MNITGKYISKRADVIGKEIQSKSVLLNLDSGSYYTLNRAGTFIWSILDQKRGVNYIIDRIAKDFDVDKERAFLDVQAFIEALKNEGLIEISDGPA